MSAIRCSLNQVEHTARKAVRGVGLPWGLAEDTGRAVRWSQAGGLDGAGALVALLAQISGGPAAVESIAAAPGGWRIESPAGCLLGAAAIADGVIAGAFDPEQSDAPGVVRLQAVPTPVIVIGFAGVAATQSGRSVWLQWSDFVVRCDVNQFTINRDLPALREAREVDIQVSLKPLPFCEGEHVVALQYGSSGVQESDWKTLEDWASRTYVPATEASRLSGAGAGVSDND